MAMAQGSSGATFSDYDPLAWFYDRYWGPANADELLPVLDEVLLPRLPEGSRVLDLMCGTGHLCGLLHERGYEVSGIDGSRAMLAYARNNAPGVDFELDDARWFQVDEPFQAVVSTYESVNHLLELEDVARAFSNVADALVDKGFFLFDMNLEPAYGQRWEGTDGVVEDDHVILTRNTLDRDAQLATSEMTLFRHAHGAWRRSDLALHERWYDEEEILVALEKAGFETAAIYDAVDDLGLEGQDGREFFLVQKGPS